MDPFITVFTPNYNKAKFISESISSILEQTYSNFEYIIIDDGSTDDSWQIINKYAKKDNRIKAYRNEKNRKIVYTRNKGFSLGSPNAKYYAILDSDDIALPNRLKIQVAFLENHPDYGLVGSDVIILNEFSEIIGYRKFPSNDAEIKRKLLRFNQIPQSSVLLRKEVIREIGMYHDPWDVCQDYEYWLRVGRFWKLKNINKALIKYRLSNDQIKKKFFKKTIKNTILIQKLAIEKYGYKDNPVNNLLRRFLKLVLLFPNVGYRILKSLKY